MTEKGWKKRERTVAAKIYGATGRVALSGGLATGKKGDVAFAPRYDDYIVEVKGGKSLPKMIENLIRELCETSRSRLLGEIPVLVFRPLRMRTELVVMTLDDFERAREKEYLRAFDHLRPRIACFDELPTIDKLIKLRQDGERIE